jgi:4-alpha-glucanotransferase
MIRLDHFRGFAAAWHVPIGAATAETGKWVPGPGADFFCAAEKELGALPFIAEDLGLITPDVCALRDQFRLPGMRVLQFAFDGKSDNPHLPHNYAPIRTPGPTTIPRLAAGSKNCRVSKDNTCGII